MSDRRAAIFLGPGLSPREAAIDAVYRFAQGLDEGDEEVFRSAFTAYGILDMSRLTSSTGKEHPEQQGIEALIRGVFEHVGRGMDCAHHLSNVRVKLNDRIDRGEVSCYAWAQHFRLGEGKDVKKTTHLTAGSVYRADVVRDHASGGGQGLWKIERLEIHPYWCEGDLGVIS